MFRYAVLNRLLTIVRTAHVSIYQDMIAELASLCSIRPPYYLTHHCTSTQTDTNWQVTCLPHQFFIGTKPRILTWTSASLRRWSKLDECVPEFHHRWDLPRLSKYLGLLLSRTGQHESYRLVRIKTNKQVIAQPWIIHWGPRHGMMDRNDIAIRPINVFSRSQIS